MLGAVLSRVSSFLSPQVRIDTGQGKASLNCFAALIGTSSAGKSVAHRATRDLLPVPLAISDEYRDSLPLGSGEGVAESFYGMQDLQVPNAAGTGVKTVRQRAIIRSNVSFYVDEGEGLSRMLERSGSTIGTVLRTAWIGDALGQANASADRQRDVPGGTYALGLVIGFQRATVQPLLAEGSGGSPQRFLFLSAHSEPPEGLQEWPGELPLVLPSKSLRLPPEARHELIEARREAMRPGAHETGLDGHRPLHLSKVAALLCILDRRADVSIDDWELAHQVWEVSCAVRDGLVQQVKADEARKTVRLEEQLIRVNSKSAVASQRALQREAAAELERMALWIVGKVRSRPEDPWRESGKGSITQARRSTSRARMPDALEEAEMRGWITRDEVDGTHYVRVGEVSP
jgi:hypothetical protein